MNILTGKDQLRNKITVTEKAITYASDEYDRANARMTRKENWKLLSFIADENWLLRLNVERTERTLELLREYRQQLLNRFNEA